jgi:replicative DNA helicase
MVKANVVILMTRNDVEKIILSYIIKHFEDRYNVFNQLPADFFEGKNKKIYQCFIEMDNLDYGVLEVKSGIPAEYYIQLINDTVNLIFDDITIYINKLKNIYAEEKMKEIYNASGISNYQKMERMNKVLFEIEKSKQKSNFVKDKYYEYEKEFTESYDFRYSNVLHSSAGMMQTDLIVLAAKPKNGKTTLALNMTNDLLNQGYKVLFVTYEIDEPVIYHYLLGIEYRMTLGFMKNNPKQRITCSEDYNDRHGKRLMIKSDIALEEIDVLNKTYNFDFIIIDYDKFVQVDKSLSFQSEERRISYISKKCKEIAKENKNVVILLSQLNKEGNTKFATSKEEDASIVILLEKDGEALLKQTIKYNRHNPSGDTESRYINWSNKSISY